MTSSRGALSTRERPRHSSRNQLWERSLFDGTVAGAVSLCNNLTIQWSRVESRAVPVFTLATTVVALCLLEHYRQAMIVNARPGARQRQRRLSAVRRSGRRRHGGIALVRRPSHARRLLTAIRSTLTPRAYPASESKTSHYITRCRAGARRSLFLENRRAAPQANSRSTPCSWRRGTGPAPWRTRQDIGARRGARRSRSAGPRRSCAWCTPLGRGVGLCANQGVRTSRNLLIHALVRAADGTRERGLEGPRVR